jgi:hypothetical protein
MMRRFLRKARQKRPPARPRSPTGFDGTVELNAKLVYLQQIPDALLNM